MTETLSKEIKEKYMRISAQIDKLESIANDARDAGVGTKEIYEVISSKQYQMEAIKRRALDIFIDGLLRENND